MIPTENQLELLVDTIQPDEVYVLYMDVTESWDVWSDPYHLEAREYVGVGGALQVTLHRAQQQTKQIAGIITDDNTLRVVKERIPEYEKYNTEELKNSLVDPFSKTNYDVVVKYTLEKEKRLWFP